MGDPAHTASEMGERLERVFSMIERTRMDGVPILNPRLQVRAIGFREAGRDWIGVLITPWFLNLVALPIEPGALAEVLLGETIRRTLPGGRFPFIVGEEPELGRFAMCSLFSPVLEFECQEAAEVAAEAALKEIFEGEAPKQASPDRLMDALARGHIKPPVEPAGRAPEPTGPLSRREVFTGRRASGAASSKEEGAG